MRGWREVETVGVANSFQKGDFRAQGNVEVG
jgi:hypothetical protein